MGALAYSQAKTLVVFGGEGVELAFDAMQVKELRRREDWLGAKPLELCPFLGLVGKPQQDQRVIVVETDDDEEVAVLAEGPVSIRTVPSDSVIPPAPESRRGQCHLLQGVVEDDERETLVIEANSLKNLPH